MPLSGVFGSTRMKAEELTMDETTDHSLPRTGQVPLAFRGALLAAASGEGYADDPKDPRWHEVAVYRTAGGAYVGHVRYRSNYKGEVDHDECFICESARDIADTLGDIEPAAAVRGFPPYPHLAQRQQRLLDDVRARYDATLSDLFGRLGTEFSERVE